MFTHAFGFRVPLLSSFAAPRHYEPPERGRVTQFRCPTCRKLYRGEVEAEPMCTGTNEGLDEHEMTLMVRLEVAA